MDNIVNKQAIIHEYLLGGISYQRLSKKYGVARATRSILIVPWRVFLEGLNYNQHHRGAGLKRNKVIQVQVSDTTGATQWNKG